MDRGRTDLGLRSIQYMSIDTNVFKKKKKKKAIKGITRQLQLT